MAFLVDRPMPTACDECPCMYDYIQCTALKDNAKESLSAVDDYTVRQTWCPIKKVVRCKECRYWDEGHTEECENSDSVCFHNGWCSPDFYCGDGEPKDGEQE